MLRGKYARGGGFVATPQQEAKKELQVEKKEERDLKEQRKKMFAQWRRFGGK